MNLADLIPETKTTFTPLDKNGDEMPIIIEAHTFNSAEGLEASKKYGVDRSLYQTEKGIKIGGILKDNEIKALARMTIRIEGIDDVNTPNEIMQLYLKPELISIPQQLNAHLTALGNGLEMPKEKSKSKRLCS